MPEDTDYKKLHREKDTETFLIDRDLFQHSGHLTCGALVLFTVLCYYQDENRVVSGVTHTEISHLTGVSRQTIVTQLQSLIDYGLVKILEGTGHGKGQRAQYQLVGASEVPIGGNQEICQKS